MGGGGSARRRLGRGFVGGSCHRLVASNNHGGTEGTEPFVEKPGDRHGTCTISGWRTPGTDGIRSGFAGGIGAIDRPRNARRPHVPVALDLQEHRQVGRGIDATQSPRLGSHGRDAAEAEWLQLAGQPQDARRLVAPGPQCSVRVHQPAGDCLSEAAATRRSRWTRKRRNWSGNSRIRARNGSPKASRKR